MSPACLVAASFAGAAAAAIPAVEIRRFSSSSLSFSSRLAPFSLRLPLALRRRASDSVVRFVFTGIVEEIGKVRRIADRGADGFEMDIAASTVLEDVRLGDSIAVDGACLTVAAFDPAASHFTVGLAQETLRCTTLGDRAVGDGVNLERALTMSTRMGGHFVQGHVDGTGEIVSREAEGDSLRVTVRAPRKIIRLLVPKGFVAVDGTSLTIVSVKEDEELFDFVLVKYTQEQIVLPTKKAGDKVNLEADILGKYVERQLAGLLKALGLPA